PAPRAVSSKAPVGADGGIALVARKLPASSQSIVRSSSLRPPILVLIVTRSRGPKPPASTVTEPPGFTRSGVSVSEMGFLKAPAPPGVLGVAAGATATAGVAGV